MNQAMMLQMISVLVTAISTSGAVAAYFNRRNRRERDADINRQNAEKENITAQAAATALAALRKELDAANADLERRRTIIQGQDNRIDVQSRQIRKLRRQVENLTEKAQMLENWARLAITEMRKAGMTPPPLPRMEWIVVADDVDGVADQAELQAKGIDDD